MRKRKNLWHFHRWGKTLVLVGVGGIPLWLVRLEGCSFMEGVWVDKPLLSAKMVTGGVYVSQCCILALGDAVAEATVSL